MKGRIHSIETLGLMDGPGIRMVVFFQGCPLRCKFCHNPDSQAFNGGTLMDSSEIINQAKRLKPYFKRSGGGVTISGGEPLMQPDFLIELLKGLREEGICTVVDTSGIGNKERYDEILKYTNLVLLDFKHYDSKEHEKLVKLRMELQNPFLDALKRNKVHFWARHVMVPGITDNYESMIGLSKRIQPFYDYVDKVEILPYRTLGVHKYKELGLKYELEGVPEMDKDRAKELEKNLIELLKKGALEAC